MNPMELKTNLTEDMKRVKKLFSEKGIKIFFAYRLDGYLAIYESDLYTWKNGQFLKVYIEGMELI